MSWFADRAVLVVGGLGFIGVNLTGRLCRLGARVTVVTRSRALHGRSAAHFEARGVRVVEGDLRDADAMQEAVRAQDVVFNLAGQSGAARSMEDPWADLDVNCRGNLVLLEAIRRESPPAKLVFASSRLAYGRVGPDAVREDHPVDPLCVHAVHKLAVEQYLKLYGHVHGLVFTIARLTNPYGPGQPSDRTSYGVVNRMIHQALADEPLVVYGDGRQRRDYIYVDDAVDALLRMAEAQESAGRIYNVGSGAGTALVDMARAIVSAAGSGRIEMVEWPAIAAQIETGDFVADIGRIGRELGWAPAVTLPEGLERTLAHYRALTA